MNWKEQPHLFANGKFHTDAELLTSIKGDIYEFDGFVGEIIGIKNDHNGEIIDHIQLNPNDCTLIARKIEDMTDDEWMAMKFPIRFLKDPHKRLDWFEITVLTADDLMHLLSIGVYPFDQSHFDTGEVIDIKEVE